MFLEPHIIIYPVLDNNPRISEGLCDILTGVTAEKGVITF